MTTSVREVGRRMQALAAAGLDWYTYQEVREMSDKESDELIAEALMRRRSVDLWVDKFFDFINNITKKEDSNE